MNIIKIFKAALFSLLIISHLTLPASLFAKPLETDSSSDEEKIFDLSIDAKEISLETLMNTVIVTASKQKETSFEAPVSSTVITKQQIRDSGVTSISEALRLAPGLFVVEQTNGNYDIHIRGFNHIPPNMDMQEAPNSISLVMIDSRPVFNYFSGGTIWETLPIDINDIEQIEVVRGACTALYGPNAASGVVNIITSRPKEEGLYSILNISGGNYGTYIGNASAGYNFGDFSVLVSGNYQRRNRFSIGYYSFAHEKYYADPEDLVIGNGFVPLSEVAKNKDMDELYPDPNLALDKKGGNLFLTYQPDELFKIDLSGGYQSSVAQASLVENSSTSLMFRTSDTGYANLFIDVYNVRGQLSYLSGELDTLLGNLNDMYKYDTNIIEGFLEYDFNWEKLIIRPGVYYRKVTYRGEYISGEHSLLDTALSFRTEYTFFDQLRVIAAVRGDKYNHPDKTYLSYQFVSTYGFDDKNIARISYSRANRESFIFRTYADFKIDAGSAYLHINGNRDLDFITIDVSEIGYKTKVIDNMEFDLEIFYTSAKNFSNANELVRLTGVNDKDTRIYQYTNLDTTAEQTGTSFAFGFTIQKLHARLFATFQRTKVDNFRDENDNPDTDVADYKGTPALYGGFLINYMPIADLNLNLNGYYSSQYTFDYKESQTGADGNVDIAPAVVLNAKAAYYFWRKSSVFINCRNILNRQERQFVGGDKISLLIMGGASLDL